jgi:hypothetical protein
MPVRLECRPLEVVAEELRLQGYEAEVVDRPALALLGLSTPTESQKGKRI